MTCRILKEIRRQIAEANDIEYVTSECRYKGDCAGTCPKCEAEVRYLETRLAARQLAGKAVALAGISAAMFLTGCGGTSDKTDSTAATERVDSVACLSENEDSIVTLHGEVVNNVGDENWIVEETDDNVSPEDRRVYDTAEEQPTFPGGESAFVAYVQSHIRYPEPAKTNKEQGRVVVQFVVTKTGEVGKIMVVRGVCPNLDKEVVRVVKTLPKFIPGKMNGKDVNVWYTLPIQFRLEGSKASVEVPGKRDEWRPPYKRR